MARRCACIFSSRQPSDGGRSHCSGRRFHSGRVRIGRVHSSGRARLVSSRLRSVGLIVEVRLVWPCEVSRPCQRRPAALSEALGPAVHVLIIPCADWEPREWSPCGGGRVAVGNKGALSRGRRRDNRRPLAPQQLWLVRSVLAFEAHGVVLEQQQLLT